MTASEGQRERRWILPSVLLTSGVIGLFLWHVSALLPSPYLLSSRAEDSASGSAEQSAGLPVRLHIPAIGVDASVERVGLTQTGDMDVPKKWENVGWYELGTRPGEFGSSVIAGHLDSDTGRAVFWDLEKLTLGDEIAVTDDAGARHVFRVTRIAVFDSKSAPLEEIFARSDGRRRLNLITCDGTWNTNVKRYDQRRVVYTEALATIPMAATGD